MNKTLKAVGAGVFAAVYLAMAAAAWLRPADESSDAERRLLAQMPTLTAESLLDTSFMADFESYTLDQFPLRDAFRRLKATVHYGLLRQQDNNGIYIAGGYAAEQCYPLDEQSLQHALRRFEKIYELYLKDAGCEIFTAVVPDKGYYLSDASGHLTMDYAALFAQVQAQMPWASYVDLTQCLTEASYYRTDTHWRQECLLPVAQQLSEAMGVDGPDAQSFRLTTLERPFYGVYCGQAALPLQPDTMCLLESALLEECTVYNYTDGTTGAVYDRTRLDAKDLYEVYLSGAQSLLRIENPNAQTDRELIVFRDSFASALVPLLMQDYAAVTLVDIRYIMPERLGTLLDFTNTQVLFLHSTLVLNKNLI